MSLKDDIYFWIGSVIVPLFVGAMVVIATLESSSIIDREGDGQPSAKTLPEASSDSIYKTFSGEGRAPDGTQYTSAGRILAEKAAFAIAKKNAASYLMGEIIESYQEINDSIVEKDNLTISVNAYVRGIKKYKSNYNQTTGIASVSVRISTNTAVDYIRGGIY